MLKGIVRLVLVLSLVLITDRGYCLSLSSIKTNMLLGDYKSAIAEGERLIQKEPHSAELYYLLALSYLKDGNYLRASDIFEIIMKEFKGSKFNDEAGMGLGDTYLLRGDYTKAHDCYQKVIKNNPNTKLKAQLYYRISEVGFKEGNTEQGKEYLTKLKEKFPLTLEVKQDQGICLVEKNNFTFNYFVQLGSFVNPANANNLKEKLISSGYPAYIDESVTASGQKSYRVGVGKLKSRQEAEELNKKLVGEGYPTKICP